MDSRFFSSPSSYAILLRQGYGGREASGEGGLSFFLIVDGGGWIPGSSSYAKAMEDRASRLCRDLSEDDEKNKGL